MKSDELKKRLLTSFYNEFIDQEKITWSKSELIERLQAYGAIANTHDFEAAPIQNLLKELEQDQCIHLWSKEDNYLKIIPPQPNWKEIILKAIARFDSQSGETWSKETLQKVLNHSLALRTKQYRNPESSDVQIALRELENEGIVELIETDAIYLRIKSK